MVRILPVAVLLAPLLVAADAALREQSLLKKGRVGTAKRQPDDDNDSYEYGDREMHARDADSSDFSPEQFLAADDARDGPSATADLSPEAEEKREQVMAGQDHFDSEDTPDTDSFSQLAAHRVKTHSHRSKKSRAAGKRQPDDGDEGYEYGDKEMSARDADSSDFSPEQFLTNDDGRDAPSMTASLSAGDEQKRENVLASQDHFDSEDTPDTDDDFVQLASRVKRASAAKTAAAGGEHKRSPWEEGTSDGYEYGDREMHARDADSSDFSAQQFLTPDDGRDAPSMTANLSPEAEAKREHIMASQDHFDSEDTPGPDDDFMQLSAARRQLRNPAAAAKL